MSRPTPSAVSLEAVRAFWTSHVNNEYYTRQDRGSPAFFDEIERRRYRWHYHLAELFAELRGASGRLLEVGSGMGVDSVRLARCGFAVTAVDLTQPAIDLARRLATLRGVPIEFRVGDAENLEFADASFDAVYSFGVLHHTPNIDRAISELHRVLRPGGKAYVMLYRRDSLVNVVHRAFHLPFESPRHLRDECPVVQTFTKEQARTLFREFATVSLHADYPFTYGFRFLTFWVPKSVKRALGRRIGWHLMISAVK